MSQLLSSAYAGLAKLLNDAGHFITPAELQGSLWGRTVAGASPHVEQLILDMSLILDEGEISDAIKQAIIGLQEMMSKELVDGSVAVTLLLPDDEAALSDRLQAVVNWGQGFLTGFGMIESTRETPAEVLEILQDIASITQLEFNIAEEDEARSEGDYMELVEFLRLVPLLIHTELNVATTVSQSIH